MNVFKLSQPYKDKQSGSGSTFFFIKEFPYLICSFFLLTSRSVVVPFSVKLSKTEGYNKAALIL